MDTTPSSAPATESTADLIQRVANRVPTRLSYYDKDLVCRFANLAHAQGFGKTADEIVGLHISEIMPAATLPEILPKVAQALSGESVTFETQRSLADGTEHFYEIHYIPDFHESEVRGIFIEMNDVTERRRIEEMVLRANHDLEERVRERSAELFESEQRYRLMVDALQDYCIYFIDENGVVTDWTESAQRLHGFSRQQMVGQNSDVLRQLEETEDEVDLVQVLRLATANGQWETRGWRRRDDGSRFWGHTVVTALRHQTGELRGLSCITRDMTAAKHLEDVMNDLNRELEKRVSERTQQLVAANKDLDVFSHMVSHDLRAPLRHISNFIGLLQEQLADSDDPVIKPYLLAVSKASKRMSTMIEGLLEYARLGRVALETQPVPLSPLMHGVIEHLKREHSDRHIEWVIDEDMPVVLGDAMMLAQAMGKLLDNAVKFTGKVEQARIEIGWRPNPMGGRMFYISDNGAGFDLSKAQNLFVMFQRQHHSMDFEGTGTGLSLSQRVIERHGGRLWCETAVGQGCTFFFTLPCEEVAPEMNFGFSALAELTS
jgi:PAS domain S-box-containing protein